LSLNLGGVCCWPDSDGSLAVRIRPVVPFGSRYICVVMEAFTAVVTTGIYCQPACSAQPRAENTRTFTLAAAAEAAGYRACLRAPADGLRVPVRAAAFCRGVRLVLAGALDHGNEDDLARRLGISARHLRRLFAVHLGVTPDGLARSARGCISRGGCSTTPS
jgi:AraC family transcriptional regulator of adaptative response / DNA-3-methyladenine glycosylase II